MCGIAALISIPGWKIAAEDFWNGATIESSSLPSVEELLTAIENRGPDARSSVEIHDGAVSLCASTLFLRGPPTSQPICDSLGNVLLYNGELFGNEEIAGARDNDTLAIANLLSSAEAVDVPKILDSLVGPWAIIYWQESSKLLWFGRDPLGRRSLQIRFCENEGLSISSVAPRDFAFQDLPPFGLCCLDFSSSQPSFTRFWRPVTEISSSAVPGGPPAPLAQLSGLPPQMQRLERGELCPSGSSEGQSEHLKIALRSAVERRLIGIGNISPGESSPERAYLAHAPVAVLFSGGIDSVLVTRLLDLVLPENEAIDLVNVSFGVQPFPSPDRDTAIQSVGELQSLSPTRKLRLVGVNVTPEEIELHRETIASLIRPADTPMDMSIASALWFAARGSGEVLLPENEIGEKYAIHSRVLFSGLGADEQLAGYKGRHRTTFRRGGNRALEAELSADLARLWWRNLGRDDRVIADHGRELRLPFLDEDVVALIAAIPIETLCNLEEDDGIGDKKILRSVASDLGLSEEVCHRQKRAMQFGSRSKKYVETDKSVQAIGTRRFKRDKLKLRE